MDMTRFEMTRILSVRALQLSMGAPILIDTGLEDPLDIAKQELKENALPLTVKRKMPEKM